MTKEILLSRGFVAVVDDSDYDELSRSKWYTRTSGRKNYASRKSNVDGKQITISMHQMILGKGADHIDGDGLNNRRDNLRLATPQQNLWNQLPCRGGTSGRKGVSWHKNAKKWRSTITLNGRHIHIGYFNSEDEAASAYDEAAVRLFGEYARPNFITR